MTSLNHSEIEQLIPHRPPFLWVDEVVELTDDLIRARKHISPELDVFRGHYPHFPVLPGVLLQEACFQAGAILIAKVSPPQGNAVPVVTRVNNVKFRQMVRPGDTIDIEAKLTERMANAFFLHAKITVGGKSAATLEFACAAAELPE